LTNNGFFAELFFAEMSYFIFIIILYLWQYILQHTEERSVPIAVRIHKTLELADDKFYVITCGKAGFKNAK